MRKAAREPEGLGLAATCVLAALEHSDPNRADDLTDEEIAHQIAGAAMFAEAMRDLRDIRTALTTKPK